MNGREAARCGEWAQHFSNASCNVIADVFGDCNLVVGFVVDRDGFKAAAREARPLSDVWPPLPPLPQNELFDECKWTPGIKN